MREFDKEKVKESIKMFLDGIGETPSGHTLETPERAAKMWEILLGGRSVDPSKYIKLFDADGASDPVMIKQLTFHSFCAHHMLPFYGQAAIAYKPKKTLLGLSKPGRILRHFAKKLQVQERLTKEVADFIQKSALDPEGVAVIVDSSHMCMSQRGVRMHGAQTRTYYTTGVYKKDYRLFDQFESYVNRASESMFKY